MSIQGLRKVFNLMTWMFFFMMLAAIYSWAVCIPETNGWIKYQKSQLDESNRYIKSLQKIIRDSEDQLSAAKQTSDLVHRDELMQSCYKGRKTR